MRIFLELGFPILTPPENGNLFGAPVRAHKKTERGQNLGLKKLKFCAFFRAFSLKNLRASLFSKKSGKRGGSGDFLRGRCLQDECLPRFSNLRHFCEIPHDPLLPLGPPGEFGLALKREIFPFCFHVHCTGNVKAKG